MASLSLDHWKWKFFFEKINWKSRNKFLLGPYLNPLNNMLTAFYYSTRPICQYLTRWFSTCWLLIFPCFLFHHNKIKKLSQRFKGRPKKVINQPNRPKRIVSFDFIRVMCVYRLNFFALFHHFMFTTPPPSLNIFFLVNIYRHIETDTNTRTHRQTDRYIYSRMNRQIYTTSKQNE